ncbi:amidohydrolase family protein [Paracnuella aquatica]|uniref:amidohydrolase family protein n=1 Tax=Paracnuella aquatica TaxID=2268757 RepID=UPI000DEF271A|nr:amidohydrolase family protein [Paracnuella aquatica]RPD50981.1 amidohydrolase family protein [Paracnuella aquatica]
MKWFLLLLLVSCSLYSVAQTDNYLIRAGKLFDSETGRFLTGRVVLVKGRTIEAVKEEAALTAAEKSTFSRVVDLSAYAVMPGLIDCHTHLLYREKVYPRQMELEGAVDMSRMLTLEGDAYRAVYGTARAKGYLENGITSVQDLGNSGLFADVALRRGIEEGLVPGPRMRCSGPGLSTEGGQLPGLLHKHRHLAADEYRVVTSAADGIQAVRENLTQGASVIKIFANNTPNNTMLSRAEIEAIVQEAHRYGVRVTAHATSNTAVWTAVMAGVDGIEHGYQIADSTMELMARRGTVWVPTFGDSAQYAEYISMANLGNTEELKAIPQIVSGFQQYRTALLKRGRQKGLLIAAGSDDYLDVSFPMGETSKRNLIGYVEAGVPLPEVLQWATRNAAKQLAWEGKIGVLKKGAWADIVAFDTSLDTNINALLQTHFVMKGGKIYVGAEHVKGASR